MPEGAVFTPDGEYLLVGNYLDRDISILKVDGTMVTDTSVSSCRAIRLRCGSAHNESSAPQVTRPGAERWLAPSISSFLLRETEKVAVLP